jgi:hypothetical protein
MAVDSLKPKASVRLQVFPRLPNELRLSKTEGINGKSGIFSVSCVAVSADVISIMAVAIARSRGSKRKLPPEYARSQSIDDIMAGSGGIAGKSGQRMVWKRYPERWVLRGLITRSGIQPRRCRLVQWMESAPN